jgi:hypothetical protein
MLWILLIVLFFLTIVIGAYDDFCAIFPGILVLFVIVAIVVCTYSVVNGRVIDEKIEMYTEENAAIEESIDALVTEYMSYESKTFSDLKGDSAIALVSLYPELKSDELIKAQIEIYQSNNATIRSLKAAKINISNAKWWLYFGS